MKCVSNYTTWEGITKLYHKEVRCEDVDGLYYLAHMVY
jgi:hypothetical protein